jgi:hypothetical protein
VVNKGLVIIENIEDKGCILTHTYEAVTEGVVWGDGNGKNYWLGKMWSTFTSESVMSTGSLINGLVFMGCILQNDYLSSLTVFEFRGSIFRKEQTRLVGSIEYALILCSNVAYT